MHLLDSVSLQSDLPSWIPQNNCIIGVWRKSCLTNYLHSSGFTRISFNFFESEGGRGRDNASPCRKPELTSHADDIKRALRTCHFYWTRTVFSRDSELCIVAVYISRCTRYGIIVGTPRRWNSWRSIRDRLPADEYQRTRRPISAWRPRRVFLFFVSRPTREIRETNSAEHGDLRLLFCVLFFFCVGDNAARRRPRPGLPAPAYRTWWRKNPHVARATPITRTVRWLRKRFYTFIRDRRRRVTRDI